MAAMTFRRVLLALCMPCKYADDGSVGQRVQRGKFPAAREGSGSSEEKTDHTTTYGLGKRQTQTTRLRSE